jgi:hypothetical protein
MNKTISLAAIAMVAVIMGLSAFAPAAMADRPQPGEETAVCHFDRDTNDDGDDTLDDRAWEVLTPNNHGATHGHQGHGDDLINDDTELEEGQTTTALCLAEDHADPDLII